MAKDVKEDGEELEAACRHLNAIDGILLGRSGIMFLKWNVIYRK